MMLTVWVRQGLTYGHQVTKSGCLPDTQLGRSCWTGWNCRERGCSFTLAMLSAEEEDVALLAQILGQTRTSCMSEGPEEANWLACRPANDLVVLHRHPSLLVNQTSILSFFGSFSPVSSGIQDVRDYAAGPGRAPHAGIPPEDTSGALQTCWPRHPEWLPQGQSVGCETLSSPPRILSASGN